MVATRTPPPQRGAAHRPGNAARNAGPRNPALATPSVSDRTSLGRANNVKLLVLTTEPITADQLRNALPTDTATGDAEVMVVAPALHKSALRFWVSDADEAIAKADEVQQESLQQLGEAGISASGDTGESEIDAAIEDALKTFPADRILIFTHPDSEKRYREDVDPDELQQRFGVPVTEASTG
jgi:hypothetical protein